MSAPAIVHLNCCTMHPRPASLLQPGGRWLARGHLVAHVLCVESHDGLVLVDSGIGLADVADPAGRLGRMFVAAAAPALDPAETALRQIEALGHRARDVRHIVLTHLDVDHSGGLCDFPDAEVHVLADEHAAAMRPRTEVERHRYRGIHFAHGPTWRLHEPEAGERFLGFERVRAVVEPEILLLPTRGHTRGHAVVAVRRAEGWLLHAGDAYFHKDEVHTAAGRCPPGLALFQRALAIDDAARRQNQARLRELCLGERSDVAVFCAHDASELEAMRAQGRR